MQADNSKILLLHADDYGMAPGVGKAIRALIAEGRLSGTSAMTVFQNWPEEAKRLQPYSGSVDVGMHFTLTDQKPLADWSAYTSSDQLPSLAQIIRLICSGRVPGHVVREEFGRQIDSFTKAFGSLPAYIDGHHHVHQLPVIREIVVRSVSAIQGSNPIFVRNCYVRPKLALQRGITPLKAIGLAVPGRGMVTWLKRYGLRTNSDFSGVYDLSGKASYSRLFQRFLVGANSGHLIMCHPGHVDEVLSKVDSFTKPRSAEYEYFAGGQFPELLRQHGFRIGRIRDLRAKGTENEISHRHKVKDKIDESVNSSPTNELNPISSARSHKQTIARVKLTP